MYTWASSDYFRRYFTGVEPSVSVEESCMYTMTPDENPVIDTVPGNSRLVIAVGFSGKMSGVYDKQEG